MGILVEVLGSYNLIQSMLVEPPIGWLPLGQIVIPVISPLQGKELDANVFKGKLRTTHLLASVCTLVAPILYPSN